MSARQFSTANLHTTAIASSGTAIWQGAKIFAATVIVAVAAHISFPLPFTPIPFTLQPLAVLLVGLWLGPWDGALALLAYLAEGALNLPVFSPVGPGGLAQLLGPTGGYLMAYPFVAFVAGGLTASLRNAFGPFRAALVACSASVFVLFAAGASWLGWQGHLGWKTVWMAAILPFLPGEFIKVFAAAGSYRALTSTRSTSKQ